MYTITDEANKELCEVACSLYRHKELMELLTSILTGGKLSTLKSEIMPKASALAEIISLDMEANYSIFMELLADATCCDESQPMVNDLTAKTEP